MVGKISPCERLMRLQRASKCATGEPGGSQTARAPLLGKLKPLQVWLELGSIWWMEAEKD
jgi:hypothetical protein